MRENMFHSVSNTRELQSNLRGQKAFKGILAPYFPDMEDVSGPNNSDKIMVTSGPWVLLKLLHTFSLKTLHKQTQDHMFGLYLWYLLTTFLLSRPLLSQWFLSTTRCYKFFCTSSACIMTRISTHTKTFEKHEGHIFYSASVPAFNFATHCYVVIAQTFQTPTTRPTQVHLTPQCRPRDTMKLFFCVFILIPFWTMSQLRH